jgi:hypothetical protein
VADAAVGGHAPQAIQDQFESSFLHVFPGTDAAWVIVGVLEFGVFLLLLASVVRGEFLPQRPKSLLRAGLSVALITYACLSFGETVTGQLEGTASLYQYFGATAVILLLVSRLEKRAG